MANSKRIGGEYERDIAKFLTKWVSGDIKPYIFWRQDASGSIGTVMGDKNFSGDIKVVVEEYKWFQNSYSLECKRNYDNLDFQDIFQKTKKDVLKEFWLQANKDVKNTKKQPILFYKKKGKQDIIGITETTLKRLKNKVNKLPCMRISYNSDNLPDIIIYNMEDFFKKVKIEDFKND